MPDEIFELTLLGGPPEKRYRRLRPDIERVPWSDLSPESGTEAEVLAARRAWTAAALQEYAGAASHSLLMRAIVRARAPLDLSAVASKFILDELAHAELCARIAAALGGGTPLSYDRERVFPGTKRDLPPEMEAAELVIQNCLSESWSHELLHAIWKAETHPVLREARGLIAKDEAGHGQFGWLFVDWLEPGLEEKDRAMVRGFARGLLETIRRAIAETARLEEIHFNRLTPMALGKKAYLEAAEAALQTRVIGPLRERGLG